MPVQASAKAAEAYSSLRIGIKRDALWQHASPQAGVLRMLAPHQSELRAWRLLWLLLMSGIDDDCTPRDSIVHLFGRSGDS